MSACIIGISTRNLTNEYDITFAASPKTYVQALAYAGAAPVLIPLGLSDEGLKQLLPTLDGVLFTGGGDIATERYGGQEHPKVFDVDKERDAFEFQLVHDVVASEKPFLGICRGFQVINVAFGGTLYSHISSQHPSAIEHHCFPGYPFDHIAHTVELSAQSRIAEIMGRHVLHVNSLHHQGIREPGGNLKAVGYAPDGILEAVELPGHPFGVAVQWHPEWMPDDPYMQALFKAFTQAASRCG
jgi:putative glutamine amidotransferase